MGVAAHEKNKAGKSILYEIGVEDNELSDLTAKKYPGLDVTRFWSVNDTIYLPIPPPVDLKNTNVARPYDKGLGGLYYNTAGKTVGELATQFGVTVEALKSFNEVKVPGLLKGSKPERLYIPNRGAFPSTASNPEGIDGPEMVAPESGDGGEGN